MNEIETPLAEIDAPFDEIDAPFDEIDELVDDTYLAASAAACGYVAARAAAILAELGFGRGARAPAEPATPTDLAERLGVAGDRVYALAWLLWEAAETGAAERTVAADGRQLYRPTGARPDELLAVAAAELAVHAATVGSSTEMFDFVAAEYPAFLRGEKSGPYIVLKGRGLELWESYFSAANPLYDIHNRAGALGVARALAGLGRPARVLELGTGAGGGTAAILDRLGPEDRSRIAGLTLSDIAPSFLVRTLERLSGTGIELARKKLDFSRSLTEQGIEPGSVDLVVAVNAVHNGDDVISTLGHLEGALAPDGVVAISESICGAGAHVHQDFVFNLLPPTQPLDANVEVYSRFFSAAAWRRILDASGFEASIHCNTRGPELALLALARPAA